MARSTEWWVLAVGATALALAALAALHSPGSQPIIHGDPLSDALIGAQSAGNSALP